MIKRFVASTSVTACQRSFSQSSSVCGFFSIVPFSVTSTATASHTACAAYKPRMPHVMEPATSARATCRGCNQKIAKGELRFGERQPNAFGEGEMTLWFHLACAAYKRPEAFLEVARESTDPAVVALIP